MPVLRGGCFSHQSLLSNGGVLLDLQSDPEQLAAPGFVYRDERTEALQAWHTFHVSQFRLDTCVTINQNNSQND